MSVLDIFIILNCLGISVHICSELLFVNGLYYSCCQSRGIKSVSHRKFFHEQLLMEEVESVCRVWIDVVGGAVRRLEKLAIQKGAWRQQAARDRQRHSITPKQSHAKYTSSPSDRYLRPVRICLSWPLRSYFEGDLRKHWIGYEINCEWKKMLWTNKIRLN